MSFKIPYVCTLSPILREVLRITNRHDYFREQVEGCVETIDSNENIAASLKRRLTPKAKSFRQIDIRADSDNSVVWKNFIHWNEELNCWHVLSELAAENHWEDHYGKPIDPSAN